MKLGYTDFIDKHKTKALIIFAVGILLIFLPPILYYKPFFRDADYAMSWSFFSSALTIIIAPIKCKQMYLSLGLQNEMSFTEYFKQQTVAYPLSAFGSLTFWFAIIAIIIVLVQHFKHKKVCKPLLFLPLIFYMIYIITYIALTKLQPFIGFYLAIIFEVLIILYCAGFQRLKIFPKRKTREPKPRRLTDKERIAVLERQVAELQNNQDKE